MYIKVDKNYIIIGIIILSLSEFVVAKNIPPGSINFIAAANNITDTLLSSNNENEDYYDEPECKPSVLPPSSESMCCGVDVSSSNRIVGGSATLINQYPWLALIEYAMKEWKNKLVTKCGGSLISSLYVVTAAHCVTGDILEKLTPFNVILGDYNRNNNGPDCVNIDGFEHCSKGEIRIGIKNIRWHKFDIIKAFANDIALIELERMAPYTDFIRPICLPTSDLNLTNTSGSISLTVAGWGAMEQGKIGRTYTYNTSDVKRHVQLPYVPNSDCKGVWVNVTEKQICAGGLAGQDACMGDSGSALMFNNDGQYELAGVVSYGLGAPCGRPGVPSVYTNVYRYTEWIMDIINKTV